MSVIKYIKLTHCYSEADIFLGIEYDESVPILPEDIEGAVQAAAPIYYDGVYWDIADFVIDTNHLYDIVAEPL